MNTQKPYCKAGNVELTEQEAFDIYNGKKYICTSTAIYQAHFRNGQEQKICFSKIADIKGLAKRGRYYTLTATEINHILDYPYLREDIY